MTIHIITQAPGMDPRVTAAYNRAIDGVPHCYPMHAEDLAAATKSPTSSHGRNRLHSHETWVATSRRRVVAFASTAIGHHGERGDEQAALIRMFWYERGQRAAGQALLEVVEGRLHKLGHKAIYAFDHDFQFAGYHLAHADLTDRWDHVHGLLGINGYRRVRGEVFLDWQDFDPPDPGVCPLEAAIHVERCPPGDRRGELSVHAFRRQEKVGTCICCSGGEFCSHPDAREWVFTCWLWVDERLQGLGLGRHILLRALNEARADGYAHAAISTEASNHRALLFYGNIGYHAVDWTSMYCKGADHGPA